MDSNSTVGRERIESLKKNRPHAFQHHDYFNQGLDATLTVIDEALAAAAPKPAPACEAPPDKARCSLCGCSRIPLNKAASKFGACTFVGCKDPLHDYDRERALAASVPPPRP